MSSLKPISIHREKSGHTYSEGQVHKHNEKGTTTRTDMDATNKILEGTRSRNKANQAYGKGDTFSSTSAAVARLGKVAYENEVVKAGGEVALLEARARTFGSSTSRGAEAQASLVRVEYGFKYNQSFVTVGNGQHEILGAGAKGNFEFFTGAQTKAEAGVATKGGLPYAYAGAWAFAGARASASGSAEGRVVGVSVGAEGNAYAWAGAQAGAQGSIGATGASAEAGAFAGAAAGVEGDVAVGGIGVGGSAEASAGIGAQAEVSAGLKDGEITFSAEAGAALGVGVGFGVEVSVDVDTLARDAAATAGTLGYLGGQALEAAGNFVEGAGQAAADGASQAAATGQDVVEEVVETVTEAVEDGAEAVGDAANAAGQAASGAVNTVAGWLGF